MKKVFAIISGLMAVSAVIAFASQGDFKIMAVGAIFAVLAVVLWPRQGKTRRVIPEPPESVPVRPRGRTSAVAHFERDRDIIQESLQIMEGTMKVDTFMSRYKTARTAADRLQAYTDDRADVDEAVALIDEAFVTGIMGAVDRELQSADRLKTSKGRIERAEKALELLRTSIVHGEGSKTALAMAVEKVEEYISRQ